MTPEAYPPGRAPPAGSAGRAPFRRLAAELVRRIRGWEVEPSPWPDDLFTDLALRVFRVQYEGNPPFRRYCEARGATPASVSAWTDVPAVPTAGFREVPLVVGDPERVRLSFLTSGTTGGPERRGRHFVPDPGLYRASLEAAFRVWVMQGDDRLRMITLLPRFTPDSPSSLGWMGRAVTARFGHMGAVRVAREEGFDWRSANRAAARAEADGEPVCILTTTVALDEWLRQLAAEGRSPRLPPGSRLMDTGGSKGRSGLDRASVAEEARRRLGLDPRRILNELGMTELLSQRYAALEASAPGGPFPEAGLHYGPPWLRTRVLDPVTLRELPEGETGLLAHFDLANAGSVSSVLTEDLGRARAGAIEHLGRLPGAPPRGCSLATAELLAAQVADRAADPADD